jgi:hypothetical protein
MRFLAFTQLDKSLYLSLFNCSLLLPPCLGFSFGLFWVSSLLQLKFFGGGNLLWVLFEVNKLITLSQLNGIDDFSHWSDVLNNLGAGTDHMC